jgi:hypothetical protein
VEGPAPLCARVQPAGTSMAGRGAARTGVRAVWQGSRKLASGNVARRAGRAGMAEGRVRVRVRVRALVRMRAWV